MFDNYHNVKGLGPVQVEFVGCLNLQRPVTESVSGEFIIDMGKLKIYITIAHSRNASAGKKKDYNHERGTL